MVQGISLDEPSLDKILKKVKDRNLKIKIFKQIKKILDNPEIGKPMKYSRKGTREIYIKPFRLSYYYIKDKNKIIFFDIYHKDEQ